MKKKTFYSFTAGLLNPILWQATSQLDSCQCTANATIGVILIWFPGSSLVYGAHEVLLGSYINGSARLIKGIISALVIALFYTVGWQYFGQDWWTTWYTPELELDETSISVQATGQTESSLFDKKGPIASLPPSRECPDSYALPWYMGSVVFAIPFNLASLVVFNVRFRDVPGVLFVAQATYFVQGALSQCEVDTCALPTCEF